MRMSIRWKLTCWYAGVLAVVLTGFSLAVYLVMRHQALERIDDGLKEELSDVIFEVKRASDAKGLDEWLHRRFFRHEGFDFQITKVNGERVFANARLANTRFPLPSTVADTPSYETVPGDASGRWRIVNVQTQGPEGPLTDQVARSLASYDHELDEVLLTFVLTGPVTLLVAVGGGYFLASRVVRPMKAPGR